MRGKAWQAAALALAMAQGVRAETIAPSDTLSLQVVEWQVLEGTLREWASLAGPYEVREDGTIDVPFVGQVQAAGRTTQDLGAQIAAALADILALPTRPAAIVEIDGHAPVIVGGMVRSPGEIEFRSGMTVRHAVALAGGIAVSSPDSALIQRLNADAQARILADEETGLVMAIARLQAERDGAAEVSFPAHTDTSALAGVMMAREQALFVLRRDRLARELVLIDGRRDLLGREIETLDAKSAALDTQKAIATEQRDAIKALSERGLAVTARRLDAEQTLNGIETQILDVATARLRAGQALAVAETERLGLVDGRAIDTVAALQKAEAGLAALRARLALQIAIAALTGPGADSDMAGADASAVVTVVRRESGAVQRIGLAWDAPLAPGDLVEVALPAVWPEGG